MAFVSGVKTPVVETLQKSGEEVSKIFDNFFHLFLKEQEYKEPELSALHKDLTGRIARMTTHAKSHQNIDLECICFSARISALFINQTKTALEISKEQRGILTEICKLLKDEKSNIENLKEYLNRLKHLPVKHEAKRHLFDLACQLGSLDQIREVLKIRIDVQWASVKSVLDRNCSDDLKVAILDCLIPLAYFPQPDQVIPALQESHKGISQFLLLAATKKLHSLGLKDPLAAATEARIVTQIQAKLQVKANYRLVMTEFKKNQHALQILQESDIVRKHRLFQVGFEDRQKKLRKRLGLKF